VLGVLGGAVVAQADDSLSAPVTTALNESDPLSVSDDSGLGTTKSNIIPDATPAVAPAQAPRKSLTPAADAEAAKAAAETKAAAAAQASQAAQARAAAAAEGGEGMVPGEMMEARMEAQQEQMERAQEQMHERAEMIGEVLSGGE
jgi:hypothetical protein